MRLIIALLFASLVVTAQERIDIGVIEKEPPAATNEVFLFCRDIVTASNIVARLDAELGYPNPATKTMTAVNWQVSTNGTNAIIQISLSPVYAPRLRRYLDVASTIESKLTRSQWGDAVQRDTNTLTTVRSREVTRIDSAVADRLGGFTERTREAVIEEPIIKTR